MSNNKSSDTSSVKAKLHRNSETEVVKQGSAFDIILWIIALALLFGAVMANTLLPKYWVAANDVWVRVGVILTSVIVAFGLLYITHQGKAFIQLLKESRIELRRVIWPTKAETTTTSWQVIVVVFVTAVLLWCLDSLFSLLMKVIIG